MARSLLQTRDPAVPFYDAWESLRGDARADAQRASLARLVAHAREQVPFYRERLDEVDLAATHPLARVPILTAADLRAHLPPRSGDLLSRETDTISVFQSGGTTGGAKTTLFSSAELDALDLHNARGFYALGLRAQDKVANLFAVGGLYMTFVHTNRMLQQYGCMNFPFSNHTPVDFIHSVATQFGINAFTGIASVVLSALRGMTERGVENLQIDKVLYGGEHLYDSDKEEIRSRFGTEVIAAPGYGTVDSWYIGYQCLACPTGVFHAHDDGCHIEIVDPDTGRHCGPGETGTLLATALPRRLTPIIRYRVGDRAQWLSGECPCGRATPLFKLLGRADDVLRIGFDSVDYNYLQDVALKTPGATGTLQMEKVRKQGRDQLIVRVETPLSEEAHPEFAHRFAHAIVASRPSLREFISQRTVWPVEVQCVQAGGLPRNPRTGKLVRVIDAIKE